MADQDPDATVIFGAAATTSRSLEEGATPRQGSPSRAGTSATPAVKRVAGPDVAGCETVWRATAAEWEHQRPAGDVAKVTLDVSKDNAFLGVRSLNRARQHSPAVFSVPLF